MTALEVRRIPVLGQPDPRPVAFRRRILDEVVVVVRVVDESRVAETVASGLGIVAAAEWGRHPPELTDCRPAFVI